MSDNDDGYIPNQDAENEVAQPEVTSINPFQCPKCPKTFGSAPALRMHNVRKHSGKGWNTSGNFKKKKRGVPWRAGQLQKFQATMKRKAMQKAGARMFDAGGKKPKRFQIVYPDPREVEQEPRNIRRMNFCPYCGENLLRHLQQERE